MTMNRLKNVVSCQTVNLLTSQSCQSKPARSFNKHGGGRSHDDKNEGNNKWWKTAGTVTAASAAVIAYKVSQERDRCFVSYISYIKGIKRY